MPVYLKRWYLRYLAKIKKDEKKEADKSRNKSSSVSRPRIPRTRN